MRPVPTPVEGARSISRVGDADNLSSRAFSAPTAPLSCFITTEAELDSPATSPELRPCARNAASKRGRSSSPSLSDRSGHRRRQASPSLSSDAGQGISQPLTPILTGAFGPGSAISSPAVSSSVSLSEEPCSIGGSFADLPPSRLPWSGSEMGGVAGVGPQLVMPSLAVPRRRPFSEVGKTLGKLKILVTGQSGIGKTSLILALARCCEHIVHMDPVAGAAVDKAAEVHASTRPHPWWRADLDPAAYTRRRRVSSTAEEILDRNLCFVDCPVPRGTTTASRTDLQYVESGLMRLRDKAMDDADLLTLLSNGSGSIVDVVLYMLSHSGADSSDVEAITRLQGMTNVIPLLARADELGSGEMEASKHRLRELLGDAHSGCFSFAGPDCPRGPTSIYAVSSATHVDNETMDASILMSSDYLEPLVQTELAQLVERMFSLDGTCWLRHSAALKFVNWRRRQLLRISAQSALTSRRLASNGALVPYVAPNPYTDRRYWGRVELLSWAEGLRQSLAAERLGRRLEGTGQELSTCNMPLAKSHGGRRRRRSHHHMATTPPTNTNHQDPLGLLELASQIRNGGGLALELLSSLGIMGGLAVWFIRPELAHHWDVRLAPSWRLAPCY